MTSEKRTAAELTAWLAAEGLPTARPGVPIEKLPALLLRSPDSLTAAQRRFLGSVQVVRDGE